MTDTDHMDHPHGGQPWLAPFGTAYRILDLDSRPEEEALLQAGCIEAALDLRRGDEVLDIACATGRHAVQLAKRGYRVTGLDLNKDYLAQAENRAVQARTAIETVAEDMRELPRLGQARFDAAVIMYSSFGYFPDHADNLRVIEGVAHVLKPGGRFLLDVINRDWFVRNYWPSDYAPGDDYFVTRDFQETNGQVLLHENVFRPLASTLSWSVSSAPAAADAECTETGISFTLTYRMYSVHEVAAMIDAAGLRLTAVFGDYERSPFALTSPRILCAAARH